MASTYQPPQHYNGGREYCGEGYGQSRSWSNQPSATTLRREVQGSYSAITQPSSPQPGNRVENLNHMDNPARRKSTTSDSIRSNLQIPDDISSNGGSLPDFAAQITCLFWFETMSKLDEIERGTPSTSPKERFKANAYPSMGFRKWVVTILSTTQVTDKVVILALLFIYRLRKYNSEVKGQIGSEYRLLTVSLMLANKFLDDNTYTNKTWAEVSGISVTEIHVMEVEFLSNMRYSLLCSSEEWASWKAKLAIYKSYCEKVATLQYVSPQPATSYPLSGPPPSSMQPSPLSTKVAYPPSSISPTYNHHWPVGRSLAPNPPPVSLLPEPERLSARKRNYDGDAEEPVAKRITKPTAPLTPMSLGVAPIRADIPRLPIPNLTISTSQAMNSPYHPPILSHNGPLLPPLNGRAMSTVYPSTPTPWNGPQLPVLTPSKPQSQYSTPTCRQSPHSVQDLLSYGSSPISANFPGNPGHISPSIFLQQRSSPYKPVRNVNTLLYPPPSASMHNNYNVNVNQMHYLPLGKRTDYRSGVVPDYTPGFAEWPGPVLPQLNFFPHHT